MNKLLYKGYCSQPVWDEKKNMFYGVIDNIDDIVCYCAREDLLEEEFEKAVNQYFRICDHINKQVLLPYTGQITIEISLKEYRLLSREADKKGSDMKTFIEDCILDYIDKKYIM